VNNIYLDSHGRSDYHDNIVGVANRSKTRVRWYGPLSGQIAKPVLERKLKHGLISGKLNHALPGFAVNGEAVHPLLKSAFDAALLPESLRFDLCQREPSLFNRYRRYYFMSGDGRFRLTVDTDLQCSSGGASIGLPATLTPCAPRQILELKFGPSEAEQADRVTNSLPFRLARCSKYVLGMGHLS
jgi:hypothetical protein